MSEETFKFTVEIAKNVNTFRLFSLEAERAFIAALLLGIEDWNDMDITIRCEDLYYKQHQIIYDHITKLKHVDMVTVQDSLEMAGKLDEVGGLLYLITLQEDLTNRVHTESYARIIKERANIRKLIKLCVKEVFDKYYRTDAQLELN